MLDLSTRPVPNASDHNDASANGLFRSFHAIDSIPGVPGAEAMCCAGCFACAIGASVLSLWFDVAAFLSGGTTLIVWFSRKLSPPDERLSNLFATRTRRKSLIAGGAIVLAAACVVFILWGPPGASVGQFGLSRPRPSGPPKTNGILDGAYKGVILLTAPPPDELLLPQPTARSDLFTPDRAEPLSIPFFGVYWMFRWPYFEPPPGSYTAKESPLESAFRTTDRYRLMMEAHQNFGRLIDLLCCSEIQLAVTTKDAFATLDLIVRDTAAPGRPSLSLGRATIGSRLALRREGAYPARVILSFAVPRVLTIQKFDDATIIFNRAFARSSAKVAIDRFILIPRGL